MTHKVIWFSFALIITLLSQGCASPPGKTSAGSYDVSLPFVETVRYALSDKPERWQLSIGAYTVFGTVETVNNTTDGQWRFTSENDEYVDFSSTGIHFISDIAGRALDYQIDIKIQQSTDQALSPELAVSAVPADSADTTLMYRQIKLGDVNYATLKCTPWQYVPFGQSQECQGKLKHTVQIRTNSKGQPIQVEQWLPFLNQQLVLEQIR